MMFTKKSIDKRVTDIFKDPQYQALKEDMSVYVPRPPLMIAELTDGNYYVDILSGLTVMFSKRPLKWTDTAHGKAVSQWQPMIYYYNPVAGIHMWVEVFDKQLIRAI